jgi:hypothetical protein
MTAVDSLVPSLIAAGAALAGAALAGIFALLAQRANRKTEVIRWQRETAEHARTRFHETRLGTYTEFLDEASNAMGFTLQQAIERHTGSHDGDEPAGTPVFRPLLLQGHPDFNTDAPRRMVRCRTRVTLLSTSPGVRDAADAVVNAVIAIAAVPHDYPEWNANISAATQNYSEAYDRFIATTRAELAH